MSDSEELPASRLRGTRQNLAQWPWATLLGAAASIGMSIWTYPRGTSILLVLNIDGYGWSYIFGVLTALLIAVSLAGLVHRLTHNRRGWWVDAIYLVTLLVFIAGGTLGLPIVALGGALSFKNGYRQVGIVDGHAVVIQQCAGWDTDDTIDAGFRDGLFVTFRATGDYYLQRPSTDINNWRVSLDPTPTAVRIRYRAGQQPHQAGTLTLLRPPVETG